MSCQYNMEIINDIMIGIMDSIQHEKVLATFSRYWFCPAEVGLRELDTRPGYPDNDCFGRMDR